MLYYHIFILLEIHQTASRARPFCAGTLKCQYCNTSLLLPATISAKHFMMPKLFANDTAWREVYRL